MVEVDNGYIELRYDGLLPIQLTTGIDDGVKAWLEPGLNFQSIEHMQQWMEEEGVFEYMRLCVIKQLPYPKRMVICVNGEIYMVMEMSNSGGE